MKNNNCDTLITNAKIVDHEQGIIHGNILIENGKIKAITRSLNSINYSVKINAEEKLILPGPIDPHVHYGVFEPIEKAAISESRSAAIGGITTIIRMLRLSGDYSKIKEHIKYSNKSHFIDYSIHASITHRNQLKDIRNLTELGINSFKIYMNLGSNLNHILMDLDPGSINTHENEVNITDDIIENIIKEITSSRSTLLIHAEDHKICSEKTDEIVKQNKSIENPLELWSASRPTYSETKSISKISSLVNKTNNIYFVHIGSKPALESIDHQRKIYPEKRIFVETCPHYLTHSTDYGKIEGKVSPPLRSKEDIAFMWKGLENGSINTIGTDHVANRREKKIGRDIWNSLAGFPGVATMIPVLLSEGVNKKRITINKLADITSFNTAKIFDLYPKKGNLRPGADADLIIIDLDLKRKVSPDILQSYSDYSIYDGWELTGWPILTMVRGNIIMENGLVDGKKIGYGKFVSRPIGYRNNTTYF